MLLAYTQMLALGPRRKYAPFHMERKQPFTGSPKGNLKFTTCVQHIRVTVRFKKAICDAFEDTICGTRPIDIFWRRNLSPLSPLRTQTSILSVGSHLALPFPPKNTDKQTKPSHLLILL